MENKEERYPIYKIKEFATVKGGKRLPKGTNLIETPNSHPYIRIRDLSGKKTLELDSTYLYVDDETQKGISRYIVDEGDIIISVVGTIGLVARIGTSLDKANLTENCNKLVSISEKVDKDYLYYYLVSTRGQYEIHKGTVGAVQPKLPLKNIEDIDVVLPPLVTQRKIASILSTIDDKIELNNQMNENLEEEAMAIFREWFINNPESENWEDGHFADLIFKTLGGDWGKESPAGNNTEMVYCVRGADIPEVKNGNKGKMPYRYILPKNYQNKKLKDGDLVVEISGGSPTQSTGRICAISQTLLDRYDHGMVCTNFCRAVTPKDGYSMFIYHYWQYLYNTGLFFNYENGTTGIKNFDMTGFTTVHDIKIPDKELVDKFNEVCGPIYDKIYSNGLQNEQLAGTRDTLLPKLMSGEIDVDAIEL